MVSLEQIQDGNPNTMDVVMGLLQDALIAERDRCMAYGSGSGRPTGIYQSSGITDVSGVTSVTYANLVKLFFSVAPIYRDTQTTAWIANGNVQAMIQLLTDDNQQPLLLSNLQNGWKPMLFGKSFICVPSLPDTFIGFGCHALYRNYYHLKAPMMIDVSTEAGDAFDLYSAIVRLTERCDGRYVVPSTGIVPYARSKILTGVTALVPDEQ
jgi:HK97 family phage major capsid protein